ncbi:MAG: TM2 domain-containing protein [Oscillospiraceae bacterium]|nr:TM2 domain-containing protein [Oscillospiraceae bacterium]
MQPTDKNRTTAGILAILLGSLGVHKFYLGYTTQGIITIAVSLLTFGIGAAVMEIIGIVEGIIYLGMSEEQFVNTYVYNKKFWF